MRGTSDVFQWAIDGTLWYTPEKALLAGLMACFGVGLKIKLSIKFCSGSAWLGVLTLTLSPPFSKVADDDEKPSAEKGYCYVGAYTEKLSD